MRYRIIFLIKIYNGLHKIKKNQLDIEKIRYQFKIDPNFKMNNNKCLEHIQLIPKKNNFQICLFHRYKQIMIKSMK